MFIKPCNSSTLVSLSRQFKQCSQGKCIIQHSNVLGLVFHSHKSMKNNILTIRLQVVYILHQLWYDQLRIIKVFKLDAIKGHCLGKVIWLKWLSKTIRVCSQSSYDNHLFTLHNPSSTTLLVSFKVPNFHDLKNYSLMLLFPNCFKSKDLT